MSNGRIIYIDEDPEDITYFQEFVDGHFELNVIQVENNSVLEEIVDSVLESPPDAVVSDFMLNDKATVSFNGQSLIELLQSRNKHIPCFLLTSRAPDAMDATHDARIVQSKAVILGNNNELGSLFKIQIAKIIENHNAQFAEAEEELSLLLGIPKHEITAQQRKRIIDLDNYFEEHGLGTHPIPDEIKDDRSIELLTKLVHQVDELLKKNG